MTISTAKRIALMLAAVLACAVTYFYPYVPSNSDVWGDLLISNMVLTILYTAIIWFGTGLVMLFFTATDCMDENRSYEERDIILGYMGNRVWTVLTDAGTVDKELTHIQYKEIDEDKEPRLVYKVTEQRTLVTGGILSRMVHGETTEWEKWSSRPICVELPSYMYFEIVENLG